MKWRFHIANRYETVRYQTHADQLAIQQKSQMRSQTSWLPSALKTPMCPPRIHSDPIEQPHCPRPILLLPSRGLGCGLRRLLGRRLVHRLARRLAH